ncbi:MAG: GAF domain-containing protein [Anaerolineae bacterium]|nr:GAF domain-containing protein [Anaerolineae bacterium]
MTMWNKLTRASPDIVEPEIRRQARLFSALMVLFIPCAAALFLIIYSRRELDQTLSEPSLTIIIIANIGCWIIYFVSRTRYVHFGILGFIVFLSGLIFYAVLQGPQYDETIFWLALPIVLGTLLLPWRISLISIVLHLFLVLLLPLYVLNISWYFSFLTALNLGSISLMLLLFVNLRRQDLAILQQEREHLSRVSDDLRQIRGELEERIEARTRYADQLFVAEREQRSLAEALLDTAMALNRTRDIEDVLDRVQVNVGRVIPHDSGNIMLIESGIGRAVRYWGYPPDSMTWMADFPFPVNEWHTLHTMQVERRTYLVTDTHNDPNWVTSPETETIRSHMGAPLVVEDEVLGFLHVDSSRSHAFVSAQAEQLQAFANQVAVALYNARLYEQAGRYAETLEQKVMERTAALAQANEELRALAQVKDQFVANVSHELRTPITNLMLRQALLEKMPEKREKHLDVMRRETQRLNRIIEDLLQLSRLDRGRVDMNFAPFDLNNLVAQYVADRLPLAQSLGLTLTLGQRLNLPQVEGDEALLGQVLSILLTNALNYTPAGGRVDVRTYLREEGEAPWVGFSVTDTGPGIPLEEQERLFERFYRGHLALEMGVPGTGLGLALAQEIMLRHRGRVEAASSGVPGEGCVFTVWLPITPREL